jgi:hypothetical protein
MRFGITHPIHHVRADLRGFARQVQFGQVVALTRTAQDGKRAELAEIDRAIDRPTPYTRNAVYVDPATRAKPSAAFGLKDAEWFSMPGHQPGRYLRPQIDGGQRDVKAFEKLLQAAGHMPRGWFAVPGSAARFDAYGNVSRGQIIQILSQLRLTASAGYTRNLRVGGDRASIAARRRAFVRAGGQFFVVKPGEGRAKPGIYSRQVLGKKTHGPLRKVRPVFVFVPRTTYRRRLDWEQVADRTVNERLDYHMGVEIDKAIATARH